MPKILESISTVLSKPKSWFIIYGFLGLLSAIQLLLITQASAKIGWPTHYNNYLIFKTSFSHLVEYKDLYIEHLNDHIDYFKYSPSFAALMMPFAYVPDWIGLPCWNILNALVLASALLNLPFIDNRVKAPMLALAIIETLTSLQNAQSNALIAGLIIWTFICLERKQIAWAALLVALSIYIKIFGILGFILFLFYPNKWKAAAWSILWMVLIGILPLAFISSQQLVYLYKSWGNLLSWDVNASVGLSVQGWLITWFGLDVPKNLVLGIGAIALLLPLLNIKQWKSPIFRLLYLSAILIWMVIFNHKAESPTFVIAFSGVLIWAFSQKLNAFHKTLLILCFVLCSLSPTDLFPIYLKQHLVIPFVLKAVPVIAIFVIIIHQILMMKNESDVNSMNK
jgi:hypothetical protein